MRWRPRTQAARTSAVLAILGALLFALNGCFESSTEVDGDVNAAASSAALPTLDDIRAAVSMTDAQANALARPLDDWRRAERNALRADGPGFPPSWEFVASGAEILERQQLHGLIGVVGSHQRARRADCGTCPDGPRRGSHGPGGGWGGPQHGSRVPGAGPGAFLADLDLTEEQQQALRAAREEMQQVMQPLREQMRDGELTREAFRTAARAARDAFHAAVEEILTPEQLAQLRERRTARMVERLEARHERHAERSARRLELLTRILALSESQVAAIAALHEDAASQRADVLAALKDGSVTPAEARTTLQDIRESTHAAVLNELTPEQIELLEDLRAMHPRGRRHGPRG